MNELLPTSIYLWLSSSLQFKRHEKKEWHQHKIIMMIMCDKHTELQQEDSMTITTYITTYIPSMLGVNQVMVYIFSS